MAVVETPSVLSHSRPRGDAASRLLLVVELCMGLERGLSLGRQCGPPGACFERTGRTAEHRGSLCAQTSGE